MKEFSGLLIGSTLCVLLAASAVTGCGGDLLPTDDLGDTTDVTDVAVSDIGDVGTDALDPRDVTDTTEPWYTSTECQLPACDTEVTLPFDFTGLWQLTTTTTGTDCNELMRQTDSRFHIGAVHTGSAHVLDFVGTCDYLPDLTTQMGTFKGDTEISCLVQDRDFGVKSLEIGTTKFNTDGTATGTATVHLFNIPELAEQEGNRCSITMTTSLKRVTEEWPPATWYTATECALPACDPTAADVPFMYDGNWQVITTTKSTDCNETVQAADPRFVVGAVHTGSSHALNFAGTCDYLPDGTTQMGTFRDSKEITCQLQDRPMGVKSLEVSVMEFTDVGTAFGVATVYLYNIPEIAAQTDNRCQIVMDVMMNME
jgi:hypothetical protein